MKLSPHSLATTPANNVFPVPGAPYSSIPDLSLRGQEENNMGYWKCPTITVVSVYVSHMCLSMVVLSHFQNAILFSLSHEYLFQDSESAINKKVVIISQ